MMKTTTPIIISSCLCCILLQLVGRRGGCSALSPLTTTSYPTTITTRIIGDNNNSRRRIQTTQVNLGSSYSPEPSNTQQQQQQQQRWTEYMTPDLDSPTLVQPTLPNPITPPARPKIVVFGGTGRIGRRILKKLLSAPIDMDVIAFVRNKQKLDMVLYNEEDLVLGNYLVDNNNNNNDSSSSNNNHNNVGPRLHVIVGDVIARTDVYRGTFETREETIQLNEWVGKAQEFFSEKGWIRTNNNNDATNSTSSSSSISINSLQDENQINKDVQMIEAGNEALEEAISGATIIISCLSSLHRYSNLWTDYIRVPFLRVFRQDVSKWCADSTHPYYIHYLSTKKILEVAEREQVKRDAYNELERERLLLEEQIRRGRKKLMGEEEEGFESEIAAGLRKKRSSNRRKQQLRRNYDYLVAGEDAVELPANGVTPSSTDRIKFIRISHSMVGRNPFRLVSIVTNVLRSQVTRFEFLGENLLKESKLIDTIILRPGDEVTDIERDSNNTLLQLCIDGDVPTPNLGLVGRDDIADLAVVAALTKTSLDDDDEIMSFSTTTTNNATTTTTYNKEGESSSTKRIVSNNHRPHHYTWSLRWTGDGLSTASLCFVKAIKNEMKLSRIRKMKEKKLKQYHGGLTLLSLQKWTRRTRPHALSVALTVYVTLGATAWYFFGPTVLELALRARRHNLLLRFLPL